MEIELITIFLRPQEASQLIELKAMKKLKPYVLNGNNFHVHIYLLFLKNRLL